MASPELSEPTAHSALVAASTPRAVHDALVGGERAEFASRYREAMAIAAESLDLTGVPAVLATFREIAETTQRHGAQAHLRMLAQAEDLQRGRSVPTIGAAAHRAEINAKLGR
ncbi:hypothetical protein ABIA39_006183 [Nocardia sp. GAS34]|uniref:DUF6247 family protein n=1 Tax=unclassified Nocardia TaxID=2637762 RepID=UPI003D24A4D1